MDGLLGGLGYEAVPAFEREGRTHVTLYPVPPVSVGLMASGGGLLIGSFASFSHYSPSMSWAVEERTLRVGPSTPAGAR